MLCSFSALLYFIVFMMSSLPSLLGIGKELGLEGEELRSFVKEQQAKERDDREQERRERQNQRDFEQNERDRADRRAEEEHKRKLELIQAGHQVQPDMAQRDNAVSKGPKLPAFNEEKDNIDAYIQRFERYATAQRWNRDSWGANLSALLTGNALAVFSRLPVDQALDFNELKKALLKRFDKTEEGFRKSFRTSRPEGGETFSQFAIQLDNYLERWIELTNTNKTYEGLKDLAMRDQFLQVCNQDLLLFLKERIPKSIDEMSSLADQYAEARRTKATQLVTSKTSKAGGQKSTSTGQSTSASTHGKSGGVTDTSKERTCFYCKKVGHIASDCRKKKADKLKEGKAASIVQESGNSEEHGIPKMSQACNSKASSMPVVFGRVGRTLVTVLRDSGCDEVGVRRSRRQSVVIGSS
ncbi:uncharacterized protein [Argopecten irradians]|uniref:uncharacterized protein isoform X2 n=1 Tax=Argopecten irradians TaxID=31199 RepID=UPI00371C63A5